MTIKVRMGIASVTLVAIVGLIYLSGPSYAGSGDDLKKNVMQIGEQIKKGDKEAGKKIAATTAKKIEELGDLMHMFRPRSKGGLGVGSKTGSNAAKDGIEVKLRDLARDVPSTVAKEADNLEETGYWIAAMAELTIAKAPTKDQGKKTKKAWNGWSQDMQDAGLEFAKASAAKGAQQIKTAAAKVNAACNNCHSVFKE